MCSSSQCPTYTLDSGVSNVSMHKICNFHSLKMLIIRSITFFFVQIHTYKVDEFEYLAEFNNDEVKEIVARQPIVGY